MARNFPSTGQGTEFHVQPMTEARRQQVHGRLLPMDRPLKDEGRGFDDLDIWDEQMPVWLGVLVLIAGLLSIVASIPLIQAIVSISHEPPAAASDVPPPPAGTSATPVTLVEARRDTRSLAR